MKAAAPARAMRRRILRLVALAVLGGAGAGGASAQAPVRISIETAPAAALEPPLAQTPTVTPRSAFLRSLAVPGWGHVVTGNHTRGGVYLAIQSASLWMLRKSWTRRTDAERFAAAERRAVRDRLVASGVADPLDLDAGVEADPEVRRWDGLANVRGNQVEDWLAFSIFLTLLGATDAYVSAHLVDYPEPIALQLLPVGGGSRPGLELSWSVPVGLGRDAP